MSQIVNDFKRSRRQQRGTIGLIVLGFLSIGMVIVGILIYAGGRIQNKIKTQTAVDAIVSASGQIHAHGMNLISLSNISLEVILMSLQTSEGIEALAAVQFERLSDCCQSNSSSRCCAVQHELALILKEIKNSTPGESSTQELFGQDLPSVGQASRPRMRAQKPQPTAVAHLEGAAFVLSQFSEQVGRRTPRWARRISEHDLAKKYGLGHHHNRMRLKVELPSPSLPTQTLPVGCLCNEPSPDGSVESDVLHTFRRRLCGEGAENFRPQILHNLDHVVLCSGAYTQIDSVDGFTITGFLGRGKKMSVSSAAFHSLDEHLWAPTWQSHLVRRRK